MTTTANPSDYSAARARLLAEPGRGGAQRRAALARLADGWLTELFTTAGAPPGTALVAVGGFGRGELSPRSDLDVVLLHEGPIDGELPERIWYPVWDGGVALDHSVRTLSEARAVAAEDLKAQLGLLDARHIAGDPALTASLRSAVLADWRATATKRLPELHQLCLERAERHGELSFLLEPDLKEARGGLRDVVALNAIAATWLADAPRDGLDAAAARLSDVRDALHLTTGRATERLGLHDQDQVAAHLGVLDADTLLRQVYEAARTISYAGDVTWRAVERVLASRSNRGRRVSRLAFPFSGVGRGAGAVARGAVERRPLAEGVVEQDGEAVLAQGARPAQDPVLPLRAAAAAAQAGLTVSYATVRRLAAETKALPVPWPDEAREQLITLLGAGEACIPVWEALEAEGLITRLLPDWERVRCRPQRNAVHTWTVDRHLVETAVKAAAMTRRVARPDLLLVAALLHDLGKGWPGDHSEAGEVIVRDVAVRMGFDKTDTETLALLVRHHLTLVDTATRRDPDDPATVDLITKVVGTLPHLELLHALTEADATATGPAAWSSWRASLVDGLAARVAAQLAGGSSFPADADPTAEEERLAVEAARTGGPALSLLAQSHQDAFSTEPMGVELTLAVPDQPGLLGTVAGVLALHRLTVRMASLRELDPVGAGPVLLLSWTVAAEYGELPEAARLRADLRRALDGSLDVARKLAERDAAAPRRRGIATPPPVVTVAQGASSSATILEVRAHDAPGLLHRIGRALDAAGVRVRTAHVSTLGADAVDAFYVTDAAGRPLGAEHARDVATAVQTALG
ncbi:[protein-PII] uridylyltransferase [Kitasatospora atroaurantiaca]|uniref:Bifunctional uridylyltransferase/uridylyl-removing enzyme n=1 Tax=Kitasatospora atroaurantiaca TaxID=285545 RepID=A0A561EVT9_9ACTN|nr:[protein-PII] uridylyltransferase [Kitasatospora atroaurantiaca]TWE19725.1 UTP--GlnB (protein PII) uridylyltransferase GlnD [Kitasatospora atroaurantiaca]